MTARVVFVHGAGRSGMEAWPNQAPLGANNDVRFIDRIGYGDEDPAPTDFDGDADRIVRSLGGGGHVVAHSYGAVAALLAAAREVALVRSLVLFEPACLSLVRGSPAVEAHITALAPVLARARDLDDLQFEVEFLAALGAPGHATPPGDAGRLRTSRLRFQAAPWDAPLSWAKLRLPPTLVITGGWSPLYDEVARELVAHGARSLVLAGHGHRPQDHPDATGVLSSWLDEVTGSQHRVGG